MLYVEKDLSGLSKAIFDQWDVKKDDLNHKVLYCADARVSPNDVIKCIERGRARLMWWGNHFLIRNSFRNELHFREPAYNRCA